MALIKVNGVVLKRTAVGDNDVILTVFTSELGVVKASAKGVKSYKNKFSAGTALFSYSEFILLKGKDIYRVRSCELLESFYNLSTNIERIAFATYIADLTAYTVKETIADARLLSLLLNTFYLLANSDRNLRLVKSVYELKLLCYSGLAPQLECCVSCGDTEHVDYISPQAGGLLCGECQNTARQVYPLSEPCLIALRFIVYSEDKKAFAFQLSDAALEELEAHIEHFMREHIDRDFYSLTYLNMILGKQK